MNRDQRPYSVMLLFVALAAFAAAALYSANPANRGAQEYARGVAAASAGLYVSLRTLNAVLSTAQELEVSGSVVVGGASAKPLKVLEPIDDTVERIAGVVFFLMVSTAVVALAIGPISALGFCLIGLAVLIFAAARSSGEQPSRLARPIGLHGVMLAIALPLSFLGASMLAEWMTASAWEEHEAVLAEISEEVAPGEIVPDVDEGLAGGWRELIEKAGDYAKLAVSVSRHADDLVGSYVAILAVVLIKIFLLPLIILSVFLVLGRSLVRS